jgi:hypothetical protein
MEVPPLPELLELQILAVEEVERGLQVLLEFLILRVALVVRV